MKQLFNFMIIAVFMVITVSNSFADPLDISSINYSHNQNAILGWDMAPATFMPEGNNNIYLENVKKPMHAWFLAFVPGAYSLAVTMVNKMWEEDPANEDKLSKSKYYFAAIPTAMGSLYAGRKLESIIITTGEALGSYFIYSYFNMNKMDRNANANANTFYMGVGIYAFFWLVDMIYAPIMSWQYNKKLAKTYLSGSGMAALNDNKIEPVSGNALIGPGSYLPTPFVIGSSFNF